jgi:uncharacterized integral membrane protein (TIGR00697 family)
MKKTVSLSFFVLGLLFCVCLIVSNILAFKLINIGGFTACAAIFLFPLSYVISDVITEVWGFKKAKLLIWCGFAVNFLVVIFFQLAIWAPADPVWEYQEAFKTVLGSTPRIVMASLTAFLVGSFINAYIMSRMKIRQKGKNFSLRAIVSTIFGESADTMIFFFVGWLFVVPVPVIISMALFETVVKLLIEILVLPLTVQVVKKIKASEQTDVFDDGTNYNILSLKEL